MNDLFWPGDGRAGDALTPASLLAAMVTVEAAWLDVLVESDVAPASARDDLLGVAHESWLKWLGDESELSGNPVTGLVSALRDALAHRNPDAGRWLHRGLTSQDVLDSALSVCLADARTALAADLAAQVAALSRLAATHRDTAMTGRTLTQHAVPVTFGLKVAHWLTGVLDALEGVSALRLPVQLGGAAGTMAAAVELGLEPAAARSDLASRLGLDDAPAWHTTRTVLTRFGDAMVACTDAWGRVANDVLVLGRPEIGELSEGVGGGSSTMPHKANPVLSVLVRRAALTTPQLAATLHLAAAGSVDERSDGAWHAEWATVQLLVRRTLTAAGQTGELLSGLQVHPGRMAETLERAAPDVHAEQRSMAELVGRRTAGPYLGESGELVDAVLARARATLGSR